MDASPQHPAARSRRQALVAAAGWVLRLVQLAAVGVLLSLAAHHAGQRLRRAKFAALAAATAAAAAADGSDDYSGSDDETGTEAVAAVATGSNDTIFTDAFSGAQLIASLRAATGWDAHAALRAYRRLPLRPAALPPAVVAGQERTRTGANLTACYASAYRPRGAPGMAAALRRARAAVSFSDGARARAKRRACRGLKRAAFPYRRSDCPLDRVCLPSEPGRESLREHLRPRGTDYLGELGYELLAIAPWAQELAQHGFLGRSVSAADSHPFYFFSPLHCEAGGAARGFRSLAEMVTSWPHDDDANKQLVNALVTPAVFPLRNWRLPPYTAHYCGAGLTWFSGRPYVVVLNKRATTEWRTGRSLNTIPVRNGLLALYDALVRRGYTVVYHRAVPGLYASETAGFRPELDDFTALEAHAAAGGSASSLVLLPQFLAAMARAEAEADAAAAAEEARLTALASEGAATAGAGAVDADGGDADEGGDGGDGDEDAEGGGDGGGGGGGRRLAQHPVAAAAGAPSQQQRPQRPRPLSINELQLSVLADADGYVAVQGGPSYLSLLWGRGRPVLLFQVGGREVALNATAWFPHVSGSVVRTARNVPALLAGANELFPPVRGSGGGKQHARAASAARLLGGGADKPAAPPGGAG